jgi:hypothetical protein
MEIATSPYARNHATPISRRKEHFQSKWIEYKLPPLAGIRGRRNEQWDSLFPPLSEFPNRENWGSFFETIYRSSYRFESVF